MGESRSISLFFFPGAEQKPERVWRPPTDVYRTRDGWLVKLDLAGVREEDMRVEATGSQIIVSGIRRDWLIEEGWSHYAMEITYSRFERVVELPVDLDRAEIKAECQAGMLLVRVNTKKECRESK